MMDVQSIFDRFVMNAMGENMEENRKKWIQPQLIVLGRGTPEENVLAGCKTSKNTGMSATIKSCKKKKNFIQCTGAQCNTISTTS
jgi:hypothetical protein